MFTKFICFNDWKMMSLDLNLDTDRPQNIAGCFLWRSLLFPKISWKFAGNFYNEINKQTIEQTLMFSVVTVMILKQLFLALDSICWGFQCINLSCLAAWVGDRAIFAHDCSETTN